MFAVSEEAINLHTKLNEPRPKEEAPLSFKQRVAAVLMHNQVKELGIAPSALLGAGEAAPANNSSGGAGKMDYWEPVLISMARRAAVKLIAYDVCGVQPMSGPDGSIFAMRSRYTDQNGEEALFNEADTAFSGLLPSDTPAGTAHVGSDPLDAVYTTGHAMPRLVGEQRGGTGEPAISQMAFTIEKTTVSAKTRALAAFLTDELQQDLMAIHGLSARDEVANILANELLFEINREVMRTIYTVAQLGAQKDTTTPGVFDLVTDSSGRWSVERFKGLLYQLDREANAIYKRTRRGKGNVALVSADVASALAMAGVLDYAPALEASTNLEVDEGVSTYAGTIFGGRMKVFVDPYFGSASFDFACVGYRGPNPIDAGLYFCPYVPFQRIELRGQDNAQPRMFFKTRYGLVSNPYVTTTIGGTTADAQTLTPRVNQYYSIFRVANLLG